MMIGRLPWVLLLILAFGGAAAAQDVITISGAVTTRADGLPVPGAVVSVVGADASATRPQMPADGTRCRCRVRSSAATGFK